ncbi:MAG: hypothetical protein EAZ97_14740 [Bacteroidetes bacterium]|nr:MAG: hypothetical protein EAZ97_14740 [Bacteroidota bacterium]
MKYVLYLILALSGWFFWLFRNALLALPLPSITTRVFEDLGHNLTVYSDSFSLFFLPTVLPFEWRIGIFCLLILLIFAYFAYKIYKMPVRVFKIVFAKLLLDQTQTLKYGVHIFLYLSAMICLEKANFWEVERYLAIIYPFVFFNLTIFLEQFLTKKVFFQKIVCLILLFWLCYPVIRTVKNIIFWHDEFCRLSGFI